MPKITDAYYESSTDGTGYIIGYQNGIFCRWPVSVLQGTDGSTITTGTAVPNDGDGNNGDVYINKTTWDIYQKALGTWGTAIGNIKGADGTDGTSTGTPDYIVQNGGII